MSDVDELDLDGLIAQCAQRDERLALIFIDWWHGGPVVSERESSVECAMEDFVSLMVRLEAEGYRVVKAGS